MLPGQTSPMLSENTITFGQYEGKHLSDVLRDRKYCKWLLRQPWFARQYEYLYNRISDYNPRNFFIQAGKWVTKPEIGLPVQEFFDTYVYFHLYPPEELRIVLSPAEKKCYVFYLATIESLKQKIKNNPTANPYSIKAPISWLKKFEADYGISRSCFKEFLATYELPNIPFIIQDIKKIGGIEYKGAQSFIIAREKALKQEEFWEKILKNKYGEEISVQYKFRKEKIIGENRPAQQGQAGKKCFFDFVRIKTNTIYECKLNLKSFNKFQHNKYILESGSTNIVYLIDRNCIIDLREGVIYTSDPDYYTAYKNNIPLMSEPSEFDRLIENFSTRVIQDVESYFV